MRRSPLLHLALLVLLIAGVARCFSGFQDTGWNNCGIRLGELAPVRGPGRRDVCGSYAQSMSGNCPFGDWLDGENSDHVRTYKGIRVGIRCHSLSRSSRTLTVGMPADRVEPLMGREPDFSYDSVVTPSSRLLGFDCDDCLVGVAVHGAEVSNLLLLQKFSCAESEKHQCGYYPGWWQDYLNTWIGSSACDWKRP